MARSLIAYDASGKVVATLDLVVARDDRGTAIGLVDFAGHEAAGGKLRAIWEVSTAVRSATIIRRKRRRKGGGVPEGLPIVRKDP